jgi:sortase A
MGYRNRGLLVARILGAVGRTMITAGVLILLFVAYQLWGTGIRTAQAQNRLDDDLAALLDEADGGVVASTSTTSSTTTTVDPAVTATTPTSRLPVTTAPPLPPELLPREGEATGRVVIEAIGLDWVFVEGVSVADLKLGPGHYPETPLPGQAGNAAMAGHRTTYGAPFNRVDELAPGDEIVVTTVQGTFTYEVRRTEVVSPSEVAVLGGDHWDFDGDPATVENTLTLTSCHPKYSARQRMIVAAELVGEPAPATPRANAPAVLEGEEPAPPAAPTDFESDLSGDRAGAWPAIAWGIVCAALWLVAWAIGKRWRRAKWPAYLVGILPFMVALFFFFENFSRLLPANY